MLPLRNLKSTVSRLRKSTEPLPSAAPGARKVFTNEAHCVTVKPEDVHMAVEAGLPLNRALEPKAEAMPEVEMEPSARTLGRCWVSLPAPKNLPSAKPAVPVEKGYGRPDWAWKMPP